jgi:hypothetical protein
MPNYERIESDLRHVLANFPTHCLEHVLANRHRLIRNAYFDGNGGGCLFGLLSELLPADRQIRTKKDLTRFFTGSSGPVAAELPQYQPARWLVRGIDGCEEAKSRYGDDVSRLDYAFILDCLDRELARREGVVGTDGSNLPRSLNLARRRTLMPMRRVGLVEQVRRLMAADTSGTNPA